ncbi:MAG: aminotransferase class I/II-fold pyridoxal phosphate-dependent enzyme [Bacillota bacterium]|nr:aminotransferase class I/II-fold pyridoxal phosphate-dependent enzyme [Bacillota bacterium]
MAFRIFLSPPNLFGNERKYVDDAFDSNWIAPYGPHLKGFEEETAQYVGVESALACSSGTAAIHLALHWFGVGPGDYVFCSDFTFAGSCNPILYLGATPVFIDSEPFTWNMSSVALEKAFRWAEKEGKLPKAIIIVDLYGESADWDRLLPICRKYGVPVIEDAAEALGATYKGRKCGSFGDVGILSFNGNKIITTSGGGMVLSNNMEALARMRFLSTQAREPVVWYEHKEYGYNYRMSNVSAAIGRGQLETLAKKLLIRRAIHDRYARELADLPLRIKQEYRPGANYWLTCLSIEDETMSPIKLVSILQNAGIESRPVWKPMHMQPVFQSCKAFSHHDRHMEDETIFNHAICLPSGDGMSREEQDLVVEVLYSAFDGEKHYGEQSRKSIF